MNDRVAPFSHSRPASATTRFSRSKRRPGRCLLRLAFLGYIIPCAVALAQRASSDAALLARYDRNGDGRLDEAELAAKAADEAKAAAVSVEPAVSSSAPLAEDVVQLSPFEVVDSRRGYYAANTMSGTRLNARIEDLASSITVVTKEQMADFAMIDINDIFAYEASTEGSGNYTDFSFNQSFQPNDNLSSDPNTANRVRGLMSANIAYAGFETSRRVPLDPINSDAIEISRGPNSSLFGLGNASGTANSVAASAHLSRNRAQLQTRVDRYGRANGEGGYRESLDVNRVLVRDKLAVRFSQVLQNTEYDLQPSGVKQERYLGMVKYRPFRNTTLSASYQFFHQYGRRPNSVTPRDAVTRWLEVGSPTWDPRTSTAYLAGSPVNNQGRPVTTLGGGIPRFSGVQAFNSAFQTTGRGTSLMFIDSDGVGHWTAPRGTTTQDALLTTPASNNQTGFNYVFLNPQTLRASQPLWTSDGAVSDKGLYDWSRINAAAMNNFNERSGTTLVSLEQILVETRRQVLALQLGWFREDAPVQRRDFPTGSAGSTYLYVDVNRQRLDGSPNPFFLRPYLGMTEVAVRETPLLNDTYRAQVAYKLDLTQEKGVLRWLGRHQVSGYGEYKHNASRSFYYQLAMLDDHAWLAANRPRANSSLLAGDTLPQDAPSPTGSRSYRLYYVGDNTGANFDYAPYGGSLEGTYDYTWGNFAAGQANHEPTRSGYAATINGTAGAQNSLKIQKTRGVVLQSYFLRDRLVGTFGLRKDNVYRKAGVSARLLPDGQTHDYEWDQQWAAGDYKANSGRTRTVGGVVRITSWLSAHANKADSFIPADPAINLHGKYVPNPQGKGQDWGFTLSLFGGKLNLRANQFTTRTINDRNSSSSTYATRAVKMDIFDGQNSRNFSLDVRARQWLQATQGLTGAALDTAVAQTMQLEPALVALLQTSVNFGGLPIVEPEDALSRGREFELHYNPTQYWMIKANLTESEAIQSAIAQDLLDYLAERMPVWTSVIDRETGQPWYSSSYAGSQTAERYLPANVTTGLGVVQQTVGKSKPQIRKYRANLATNYYLRGLTERRWIRNLNVGGAVRWEDKGAIDYYGVQQLPAIITSLDKNRPIYDRSHLYVDVFAAYRMKLFAEKVGLTVQLNVKNIQEGGRLQPIRAFPDGTPNAYRIIEPRQFILTATFDL